MNTPHNRLGELLYKGLGRTTVKKLLEQAIEGFDKSGNLVSLTGEIVPQSTVKRQIFNLTHKSDEEIPLRIKPLLKNIVTEVIRQALPSGSAMPADIINELDSHLKIDAHSTDSNATTIVGVPKNTQAVNKDILAKLKDSGREVLNQYQIPVDNSALLSALAALIENGIAMEDLGFNYRDIDKMSRAERIRVRDSILAQLNF